jgi:hypothetical protein
MGKTSEGVEDGHCLFQKGSSGFISMEMSMHQLTARRGYRHQLSFETINQKPV